VDVADEEPGRGHRLVEGAAVDADQGAGATDPVAGVLEPRPGRTAEIEHPVAGREHPVALVDLLQLEHRTGPISGLLGPAVKPVSADVAVVSVGENTYGHPVPSTLDAIVESGSQVWRTDEHGTVTVTFEGGVPVVSGDR